MKYTQGVIDRVTADGEVIILIEILKRELSINKDQVDFTLKEGLWVDILFDESDEIKSITPNETLTKERQKNISRLRSRLKQGKGSKFKK